MRLLQKSMTQTGHENILQGFHQYLKFDRNLTATSKSNLNYVFVFNQSITITNITPLHLQIVPFL